MERQRGEPDRVRVRVQKRDGILRSERRDRDAGKPQRLGAGHPAAAAFGLAGADERQESLRQGREIGLAEASGAQDERMHAGVQHVAQGRCEAGGNPGGAAGEAGEPDEQHGPDLVARERLADADGPGRDGALLEARHLVGRQPRIDGGAEAGGQAVDRSVGLRVPVDDRPRRLEPGLHLGAEDDPGAARDRHHVADDDPAADRDRRLAFARPGRVGGAPPLGSCRRNLGHRARRRRRQGAIPFAFRNAAATWRGSFFSTST